MANTYESIPGNSVESPTMLALQQLEIASSQLQEMTEALNERTSLVRKIRTLSPTPPSVLSPIPVPLPIPSAEVSRLVRTLRLITIDIQNQVSRIKSILEEL